MSNRRHSTEKLTKRLRILEQDLVEFLDKHGVKQNPNSHGYSGYDPEIIHKTISELDTFSKNELFLLKAKWEQHQENNQPPLEEFLSLDEVSQLFDIPKRKASQFLNANNVRKVIKNGYTFWDAIEVLKIKSNPTKKQFSDLNRIKSNRVAQSHLQGKELADVLEVPEQLVARWKRTLHIENTYPLTMEKALDIVSSSDYESKLYRFLARENKKEADKAQKNSDYREFVETQKNFNSEETELINGVPSDKMFSATQSAILLGVSTQAFRKTLTVLNIESESFYTNKYNQNIDLFSYKTLHALKEEELISKARLRSSKAREKIKNKQSAIYSQKEKVLATVKEAVKVNVRRRETAPYASTLYIGPTNSGKTYNALKALYSEYEANPDGVYVYAGPLRMLAYEVYVKMCAQYGEENVGFITGEEQINPNAHLLATTAEMAPSEGESIIIDEAHWIVEPARGYNWTELLIGGNYKNLHVLTAAEAKDTIKRLIDDSYHVEEKTFTRKTTIKYAGAIKPKNIQKKTAIICFSRKMVYNVAKVIAQNTDLNVSVLYGALSLIPREQKINDFIDGKIDILVTTDVIGHGINVPLDNIVYAETEKFDGVIRRNIHLWEAAQISGRAGRFGLSEEGKVFALDLDWNDLNLDLPLVRESSFAAAGKIRTDLEVSSALIAPKLTDLGITSAENILLSLEAWKEKAEIMLKGTELSPSSLDAKINILETVASTLSTPLYPWDKNKDERDYGKGLQYGEKKPLYPKGRALNDWNIKPEHVWQIISGPFDPKLPTIKVLSEWLQNNKKDNLLEQFYVEEVSKAFETFPNDLEILEKLSRTISELKMVEVIFSTETGLDADQLSAIELEIGQKILQQIDQEIHQNSFGLCSVCEKQCSPWYSYCDACYSETKYEKGYNRGNSYDTIKAR